MGAFAVAHLLYSMTFLSSRYATYASSSSFWTRSLYLILLTLGGGFYIYMYPFLQKVPDSEILLPAVGVYIVLIVLMGALAIRTHNVATLLGSLSFMVSDLSLAVQVFKATAPMEHGHTVVMVTYYLAQLLIAVGDVNAVEEDLSKWKRS
ncbi:Lysoplasmalogenase-like protein TMEM86A [Liparis tanakae]|uniref:lysoplasmalogenase n=1 Tax=Liparis tanakae TaxID=230148 RepID=A0A4Z2J0I3_9TELE|nr:Lysoplasmalogenase-like protein TMEM86A [Liparis tanakae]